MRPICGEQTKRRVVGGEIRKVLGGELYPGLRKNHFGERLSLKIKIQDSEQSTNST